MDAEKFGGEVDCVVDCGAVDTGMIDAQRRQRSAALGGADVEECVVIDAGVTPTKAAPLALRLDCPAG